MFRVRVRVCESLFERVTVDKDFDKLEGIAVQNGSV